MDYVFYENTLLNKMIVCTMTMFQDFTEDHFIAVDNDLLAPVEAFSVPPTDVDKIYIVFSSRINLTLLDKMHTTLTGKQYTTIYYMIKDEVVYTEYFLNWYSSWMEVKNILLAHGIDSQLLAIIYEYYTVELPPIKHRRVVEYLKQYLHLIRAHFINMLVRETNINAYDSQGTMAINLRRTQTQRELTSAYRMILQDEPPKDVDPTTTTTDTSLNKRVVFIPSSSDEVALDVMCRQTDCDCVALVEFDLRNDRVHIKEFGRVRRLMASDELSNELYTSYHLPLKMFLAKLNK